MTKKLSAFLALVLLFTPALSFGQSSGNTKSIEALNLADIADDSIVVLSKDESGVSGYARVTYAYVNSICPGGLQLVEYYGAELDPNDKQLRRFESQMCSAIDDKGGETD